METKKICWGLLYDTEAESVAMPKPKIEKAAHLLVDPELDYGSESICHKFLEQYRGNQQYWALVMPPMRSLLGATDALMKGTKGARTRPPGGDMRRRMVFEDFWRATEVARVLISDPAQWEASFVGTMTGVLSANERLALPGRRCKVTWVTGDATLERIATVDWTNRKAATGGFLEFLGPVKEIMGEVEGESEIIAVAELLNLVTFAAWAGGEGLWAHTLVLYTGDNMNVHQWLESRRCGNRFAAFLVMMLCALEGVYHFEVLSSFFRTYHNITADALTRKTKLEVEALMKELRLTEVDLGPAWREHLERGWIRMAFTWKRQPGSMARTALQLASRRVPTSPPRELAPPRPGRLVRVCEWRGTLGNYARASTRLGGVTWMLPAPGGPDAAWAA